MLTEAERIVLEERIDVLVRERDAAREECGHEKAMRRSIRVEMGHWITRCQKAEAENASLRGMATRDQELSNEGEGGKMEQAKEATPAPIRSQQIEETKVLATAYVAAYQIALADTISPEFAHAAALRCVELVAG